MAVIWNHQALKGLKHTGTDQRLADPKGNRLTLRVTKSSKTWLWQARVKGIPRVLTLGTFPALGLAEARAKAGTITADLDEGLDVYVLHGAGARHAPVPIKTGMTCQEVWDRYIGGLKAGTNVHGKTHNKPRTLSEKEGMWRRLFQDEIGSMLVTEVTEDHLYDVIQEIRDEGLMGAANSAVRYIKAFFTWAKREKRVTGLKLNPAEDLAVSRMTPRSRYLNSAEIVWLWEALDDQPLIWADAYRLALMTGQRKTEIFQLTRNEVNEAGKHLELPGSRMKHGKPHIVPLGDMAWQIIQRRLEASTSKYLFPSFYEGETERPLSGFSKTQQRLLNAVVSKGKAKGIEVARWTFHDIRRTFSTHSNGLRDRRQNRLIAKDHIERVLSHMLGGVEGTYDRNDYYAEKRRALQLWEKALKDIIAHSKKKNIDAKKAA